MAIGPSLGEAIVKGPGFDTLWVVTAGLALAACLIGIQTPNHMVTGSFERGPLFQREAFGPGVVLLLGLIPFVGFSAFLPVHAEGIDLDDVGPVFALYAVLVLLIRIFGARIPDRVSVRLLGTTALVATTLGVAIVAAWADPIGVWLSVPFFAVGASLLFPALFAVVMGRVGETERSRAVGTFSIFFDLAGGAGVPILGVVVSAAGVRWAFVVAAMFGFLGLIVLRRSVVGASPDHAEMGAYEPSVP